MVVSHLPVSGSVHDTVGAHSASGWHRFSRPFPILPARMQMIQVVGYVRNCMNMSVFPLGSASRASLQGMRYCRCTIRSSPPSTHRWQGASWWTAGEAPTFGDAIMLPERSYYLSTGASEIVTSSVPQLLRRGGENPSISAAACGLTGIPHSWQ